MPFLLSSVDRRNEKAISEDPLALRACRGGRPHSQVKFLLGSHSVHQEHILELLEDLTPVSPWAGLPRCGRERRSAHTDANRAQM